MKALESGIKPLPFEQLPAIIESWHSRMPGFFGL